MKGKAIRLFIGALALGSPACSPLLGPKTYSQPAPLYPTQDRVSAPTIAPKYPAMAMPDARTGWQLASTPSSEALIGGGAQRWRLKMTNGDEEVAIHAVTFDSRRCALRVIDQPQSNAGGCVISSFMRQCEAVAGVNGGFFTPEFEPLGRMISGGVGTGSRSTASLVSGMFLVACGEPYLIWRQEFSGENGVSDLLQSGPRLVDGGASMAGLERSKMRQRTFIASDGGRGWVMGVVKSTSLGALADILATPDLFPNVRIRRALNLDGGNSSAIWMRTMRGYEVSEPGWSTVRNYIAIVPR